MPVPYDPEGGPGAKHAAILISLAAGVIVGIVAQRTRLCMVGGIRDAVLFGELWNALGMYLAGFACILLGGCPMRQLILSGEGNTDSVVAVLGK